MNERFRSDWNGSRGLRNQNRTATGAAAASLLRAFLLAGLMAVIAVPAAAVDPFYLRLLRDGSDAFNRSDFDQAVTLLRLAVFGLLEEPTLLADGLSRLGLAQAAAGDADGFRETFRRVMELEERFQAYSQAEIATEVRRELERHAVRLVPTATLAEAPAFAHLVPRPEDRVSDMPPRQRRRELERLIRTEPDRLSWPVMLAELELEEGRPRQAGSLAENVLRNHPDHSPALRVRGLAHAARLRWPEAVEDLSRSGLAGQDAAAAAALLQGLLEQRRFIEASDFYRGLPPGLQQLGPLATMGARAVAVLEQQRENEAARAADAEQPPGRASEAESSSEGREEGLRQSRRGEMSAEARRDLRQARSLASQNRLAEALVLARRVAEAGPDLAEAHHLAGELAYRLSLWPEAVAHFRQGGDPGDRQPVLRFYYAVSLFEVGDHAGALRMLESALPGLRRNEFVDLMVARIMGQSQ